MPSISAKHSNNLLLNLVQELEQYESDLEKIKEVAQFNDKKLESLCKEHGNNVWFFKSRYNDLKNLEEFMEAELAKIESALWRHYTEKSKIKLSTTDIKIYIQSDDGYLNYKKLLLEVRYLKTKYDAAVQAIEAMGWQLSYIVKLRVAMLEDVTL